MRTTAGMILAIAGGSWLAGWLVSRSNAAWTDWPQVGGIALLCVVPPALLALRIMQRVQHRPPIERCVGVLLAIACRFGMSLGLALCCFLMNREGVLGQSPKMFWGTMLAGYLVLLVVETGVFMRMSSQSDAPPQV
ncbi:unnamed protein product [Tuwongella immobilis]|uniref:Uncharacterized protein n=1 Tax=Tuwongella immobilis TaxID=692036 RepID=A0A6C2YQT8_9BACT|nr:unnamed protein product [Tuwongella immobilis]VTS04298.1 unnamed protein product [Tuwongella immobilis]